MDDWQGHLADILTGKADGFDPRCVMCRGICRALGLNPGDALTLLDPMKVKVEFGMELLSHDSRNEAGDAIWTEIDGPLARASTDPDWPDLSGHEQNMARAEFAIRAALSHNGVEVGRA